MRRIFHRGLPLLFFFAAVAARAASPDEIVVASYNIENYLVTERHDFGAPHGPSGKPEKEIAALIHVIKEINPDILGVCEIGPKDQFEDLKARLEKAGLGFIDFEYVEGPDADRHLALFSRFPIVEHQSAADVPFELNGAALKVRRGFLDVTVKINPEYKLRLVGAHLKSKLAVPEGEALLRRQEAHLLRKHVDEILAKDPTANLLLYGDFNDTKNEPAIREIMGPRNAANHLTDLNLKDSVGDRWTHFWKTADIYSRIDYFFVSSGLQPEVINDRSGIYRAPEWNEASDHRAIFTAVRAHESK